MPLPFVVAAVVKVGVGAAARVIARQAATAAAKKAAAAAARKAAEEAAKKAAAEGLKRQAAEAAAKAAARPAARESLKKAAPKAGGKGPGNTAGKHRAKQKTRRRLRPRCKLLPYDKLKCKAGQDRHHVLPDYWLRLGKRGRLSAFLAYLLWPTARPFAWKEAVVKRITPLTNTPTAQPSVWLGAAEPLAPLAPSRWARARPSAHGPLKKPRAVKRAVAVIARTFSSNWTRNSKHPTTPCCAE